MGNVEALWHLHTVNAGQNTPDALEFVLPPSVPDGVNYPVYLDTLLLNAFEPGDQRRANWVDSVMANGMTYYYPYKYKALVSQPVNGVFPPPTEYATVLRLGEQYLIRAESEANGTAAGIDSAIVDLNVIRGRAGLPPYSGGTDAASVLTAILHERRVELFSEWGHRWFDLKRTGNASSVMGVPGNACKNKGGTWNSYDSLYPIPQSEINMDP